MRSRVHESDMLDISMVMKVAGRAPRVPIDLCLGRAMQSPEPAPRALVSAIITFIIIITAGSPPSSSSPSVSEQRENRGDVLERLCAL
jgi:hypothetical protein